MARRKTTRLAFDALMVEGALIAPDMIADVAALKATAQSEADYRIPPGLKLRDEIGRSWRIAEALWARFSQARAGATAYAATQAFVDDLLRQVFGFASLEPVSSRHVGSRAFPVRRVALSGRVPIAVAPAGDGLDRGLDQFAEDHRKRSASLLVQELLNADEAARWGIATDGLKLRLLRDNASLTRPAYVEADLERIFQGGLYADFVALWLLIHESRFGAADALPSDCPLERWRDAGREAGAKARDRLGVGVEAALNELGSGFIEHPANGALRDSIECGTLTSQVLYEELLRLVYRLIFLFTTEDRGLLHSPNASDAAKALYADGYSVARLRDKAVRRGARDTNYDLYEGLKIVFHSLWRGEKALGLPALGGLFRGSALPNLGTASISNKRLLESAFRLAWITEDHTLMRVNWRDMETEELGSVYESLLELSPRVDLEARIFAFAEGAEAKGNARRISSSYYTPDNLVQLLLDNALDPLIERTVNENPGRGADSLLELSVLDPACGSGHFLLAAGRRLATRIAQLRSPGAPSAEDWRHALREAARHCLFGVDRNPMAVELCQTALWIESVDPGRPLTFLDSHVQCGDSLIGVRDLSALRQGIPDEAYKALTGDDKIIASALKKVNKAQREQPAQRSLFSSGPTNLFGQARALEDLPEEDLREVEAKAQAFDTFRNGSSWLNTKVACDLFISAFFLPKVRRVGALEGSKAADDIPTSADVWAALEGHRPHGQLTERAIDAAQKIRAFHWPLAFPQVLFSGGFDLVLGNPPWDTMSPDAKEFFEPLDGEIRNLSPDDQEKRMNELRAMPDIDLAWQAYCRRLYCIANFMKESGRYQLFAEGNLGKGDFNVYRMFVETAIQLTRTDGFVAQFVPEGLYKGANASALRLHLFKHFRFDLLLAFVNRKGVWFPAVHKQFEFCLYVAQKTGSTSHIRAAFRISSKEILEAVSAGRTLLLSVDLVTEFSPETFSVMEFSSQREVDLCKAICSKYRTFSKKIPGMPYREYMREIDMGNDRGLFDSSVDGIAVFEGRMVDCYDYRAKGYVSGRGRSADWADLSFGSTEKQIQPQWRIKEDLIPDRVASRMTRYRIGFCDVVNPETEKVLVAALIPPGTVCGHKVPTLIFSGRPGEEELLFWLSVANSLTLDFVVRKKVRLTMSYTIMDSLPFPKCKDDVPNWRELVGRAYALTAVGAEMEVLRESFGTDSQWSPTEDADTRKRLRCEIEAIVAHDVYGLTKTDMLYILDPANLLGPGCEAETFRVLRERELRQDGEYLTQRLVIEAWHRLFPEQ